MAISLLLGFFLGYILCKSVRIIFKHADRIKANNGFKKAQIASSFLLSLTDGAQDGQKFLGLLMLALFYANNDIGASQIPHIAFVVISLSMGLGVSKAGFQIIKTVGSKVSKLELYEGTCADLSTAICLLLSTIFGIPISSTHTKSSCVMGVGASKRISNVNWGIVKNMVISWILVFPCTGLLGFAFTNIVLKLVS